MDLFDVLEQMKNPPPPFEKYKVPTPFSVEDVDKLTELFIEYFLTDRKYYTVTVDKPDFTIEEGISTKPNGGPSIERASSVQVSLDAGRLTVSWPRDATIHIRIGDYLYFDGDDFIYVTASGGGYILVKHFS